ncbi:K02A2.6-like, partial [Cordylochernes scorpioides]
MIKNKSGETSSQVPSTYLSLQQPRCPSTFAGDGSEDAQKWLKEYKRVAKFNRWDDTMCLANAVFFLEGTALKWFGNNEEALTSWDDFQRALGEAFGQQEEVIKEGASVLKNRAQKVKESSEAYIQDVLYLCQIINPRMDDETKLGHLMKGVAEDIYQILIAKDVKNDKLVTLIDTDISNEDRVRLLDILRKYTDVFEFQKASFKTSSLKVKHRIETGDHAPIKQRPYRVSPRERSIIQTEVDNMLQLGIIQPSDSPWSSPVVLVKNKDGTWRFCVDYPRLNKITRKDVYPLPRIDYTLDSLRGASISSTMDLKSGYWQIEVDETDLEKTAFVTPDGLFEFKVIPFVRGREAETMLETLLPYQPDYKNDEYLSQLIIDAEDARQLARLPILRTQDIDKRRMVETRSGKMQDASEERIKTEEPVKPQPGATIGRDASSDPVVLNPNIDIPKYDGTEDPRPWIESLEEISFLYHWADYITYRLNRSRGWRYFIEENNKMTQTNGLRLTRSLLTVTDKKTHFWITNPYPRPSKIMKDQTLAYGSLPAKVNFIENIEKQNENDEIQFQINKNVSFKEQERLKQILAKYTDFFSSRLGRTNLAKHQIHTEDAKPIKHKPYRVSTKERTIIKDQIDEMLEEGIIRPSSSPWSFPVILVKKRDGNYRFCADCRKLNEVTVKDVYPIPRIDYVMDTLQGSKYFSAIDLKSGYWQVEIEERDKEKTAFTTAHGLYEFNVMPFGLCNVPATFERNMDNVLGNLRWQICLCYLDDVFIYSSDFPTHIKRLEAVLRCFGESNLKLNAKKCRFSFEEHKILAHITNQEDKKDDFIENIKENLSGNKRSITQNFKEKNGCLYKKNPNPEGREWLLVVPKKRRKEIMSEYHNHMLNGHLGVARTTYRLKNKYYWPSMLKDVSEFVKTCHLCQSRKGSNQLPSGLLQPIPPANYPFERIGIDFVGPLPSTKRRRKWIIVLTDYYTKYAETKAVPEATVKEVSTFLIEHIFLCHGAPRFLISDRGSQFTSNLMKEVMKMCKIKHCFTTRYHPQTNGLTERLNITLINMNSMYVNTEQKNWDEILPFITHAYNITIQETTGYSPFFLLFGREPMPLLDDENIPTDSNMDDYDGYIENYLDKRARTRQ